MQITFLIGNGFDLNLGLNTKYTDFYPLYLHHPGFAADDPDLLLFKKLLERGGSYDHWADFERALGVHTTEAPLNEEASLRKCLQDFKRQFARYLRSEEDRIDFELCGGELAKKLIEHLFSHTRFLEPQPRNALRAAFAASGFSGSRGDTYNILNFNYTTVIDRLLSAAGGDLSSRDSLGQVLHVHGTHTAGMIMGVDNLEQVANPTLFSHPRRQRLLLKPLLNQQAGPDSDRIARTCIQNSSEICIFGMSLGVTDAVWWKRIGEWIVGRPPKQLVIFSRNTALDSLFFEDIIDYQETVQDRFFSQTEIPSDQWDSLRDRVHVALNSALFRFEPVMDDPLSNPIIPPGFVPLPSPSPS